MTQVVKMRMDYWWLLAVMCASVVGASCASTALRMVPSSTTIPLISEEAPPKTVLGRCVHIGPGGPVLRPCPIDLVQFIDKVADKHEHKGISGRGRYAHGIFALPAEAEALASNGGMETVVAYEVATFESAALQLKPPAEDAELHAVCEGPSANKSVVMRAFSGCSVTMTGQRRRSAEWTIETLAAHGTIIGQPKDFWTQDPTRTRPPDSAGCKARRVVMVEVLPVAAICTAIGAPPEVEHEVTGTGPGSKRVYFKTKTAKLVPPGERDLRAVADFLRLTPSIKIVRIEGHADDRGGKRLNLKLSRERARSVKEFLVKHGVEGRRLQTVGYGDEKPAVDSDTDEARGANRRVEVWKELYIGVGEGGLTLDTHPGSLTANAKSSKRSAVKTSQLVGPSWVNSWEIEAFSWDTCIFKADGTFMSYLHERPFMYGSWKLSGSTLIITPDSFSAEKITLAGLEGTKLYGMVKGKRVVVMTKK